MDALSAPFVPLEAAPDGRKGKGKKRREEAETPSAAGDAEAKRAKQADAEQQSAGDGGGEAPQAEGEAEGQAQAQGVQFVGLRSVRRSKEQQKGREREKRERYAGAGAKGGGGVAVKQQRRRKVAQSSVVYLGRLPHGFYEDELHGFLSQFGEIEQLRVVRNPKTGRSRHYGYAKFASPEVAAIVAECMNNYLLFGHLLKTHLVDPAMADRDQLFYTPHKNPPEISQPKPVATWGDYREQTSKQSKKLNATMKRLKAAGIDYEFQPKPKAERPDQGLHQRFNEAGEATPAAAAPKAQGAKQGATQKGDKKVAKKEKKQKEKKEEKEGKEEEEGKKKAGDGEAGKQAQEGKDGKEVQVEAAGGEGKEGTTGVAIESAGNDGVKKGDEDVVARAKAVAERLKQEADKFAEMLGKGAVDAEEDGGAREGGEGEDEESEEDKEREKIQEEPWSDEHEEEEELLHEEQDVEEEEDESEGSEGGGNED
ncbi:hypothetical protein CLOP_g18982 [Closterium sp. NIES-67]|nr:hypothetical protein CLOP_g18982 [Closterium sp. NIES-67]